MSTEVERCGRRGWGTDLVVVCTVSAGYDVSSGVDAAGVTAIVFHEGFSLFL